MKTCSLCKRSWEDEFRLCPMDGTPLQDAPIGSDPYIGQTIAQCRLVEKIAEGDLGPIYKAEEPIRGVVAVQITPPARIASPILMEAFTDAVNHAAKLHHPNVIRVYGIEVTAGGLAVVMEYVSGTNLLVYRRGHPPTSPAEGCRLIRQAAEGVVAAHRMSLLHAALHPTRLLVGTDGNVKVGGFHRSGLREGVDAISVTPDNLPYLSPEQIGIVRDLAAPDYRTDVYALGIILYELLAGRLPYAAASPQELAVVMEKSPPLPASFANPHVSPVLGRVVNRAISIHPTDRQGSMEEFIRELDAASQTAREAAPAPSPRYEPPYAPTGQDAGLFGARSPDGRTPGPSPRGESLDDIWPESPHASEEKSFFSWFKSRSGSARPHRRRIESRRRHFDSDDSYASDSIPGRHREDDSEERTVLVSDRKKGRNKDRFLDSFTWGRGRDPDLSGTGRLPDRPLFKNRSYVVLVVAVILIGLLIAGFIYWVASEDAGTLTIYSQPSRAEVLLDGKPMGPTPFRDQLKTGTYQLTLKLSGFATEESTITLTKEGFEQVYVLREEAIAGPPPPIEAPAETPSGPPPNPPGMPARRLEESFNAALRLRQFFPPDPENAWDILQNWQRAERDEASDALVQARQKLCRAVEEFGNEKFKRKELLNLRVLLEKTQAHRPTPSCGSDLQKAYEKEMNDLRSDVSVALDKQKYVLPEPESALKFVQLILGIDPEDSQAKEWKKQIFDSGWKEAQTKGGKRQHQEALQIYAQLKQKYPDPPVGISALAQAIEKQEAKQAQWQKLNEMSSLLVRHPHGRSPKSLYIKGGECDGTLRFNGFDIEYKSSKAPAHGFKIPYEGLKLSGSSNSITFESPRLPDKRCELEQKDKNASPDIAKHYAKLQEFIGLNAEYMKP